ncbi:kinetochore-associated protein NSL1 homolog [Gopherus flavomarginatus]|uniref:kinetochore-associated protein NSL1 homolog n=1 Tax=Gopherus flavomarginatus TaxID=286002 RepID=UPI0021CBF35E|nr:kinetochore-associated protein NSL1 homolog [Gopherus flavomarginatus]
MAASPARPGAMEAAAKEPEPPLSPSPALQETRVRCCSKRWVGEVLGLCAPYVRALADGQPGELGAESREQALRDALWNFETAVQENITINGHPWQETSDEAELQNGSDIKILEDQFDELIVETATKRKQCPRKILVHVIKTMKAEQEMLKLYQPVVKQKEIKPEPSQASHMANLRQVTGVTSKQISEAMKSLPALIERAEGFSQALALQPILELCKLRQEVFAGCEAKEENKIQSFLTQVEVTPAETAASKNSNAILKRKRTTDSPQMKYYPLRRRITLNT